MFKVNRAVIMKTSSPRIVFRHYKNFIFSKATTDDIPEISRLTGVSESILHQRFATGDWSYVTKDITRNNEIVNVIWGHRGSCYIKGLGLDLEMGSDSVYLYGGYTSAEARMKGIFNTAFKEVYSILQQQGVTKLYGLVEHWNQTAYNYHLRLNFEPVARVTFLIIMFIKASFYRDLATGKGKNKIFFFFPRDRTTI